MEAMPAGWGTHGKRRVIAPAATFLSEQRGPINHQVVASVVHHETGGCFENPPPTALLFPGSAGETIEAPTGVVDW